MGAGMDSQLFWHMTLGEIHNVMKGAAARLRRQHDLAAWVAWHVEALARTKKMPKLERMQSGSTRRKRQLSADEMISLAHAWTAAVAGRM